jgi:hypothetical protein
LFLADLILIAEDEPRIVAFLEKGLRASGLSTAIANDGHEEFFIENCYFLYRDGLRSIAAFFSG